MDKFLIGDVRLYGHHGVYEFETKDGQPFLLQVELGVEQRMTRSEELSSTVNYAACHELVVKRFHEPHKLLENLVLAMMEDLFNYDKRILEVKIRIEKTRPPVPGDLGFLGVELCRKREFFSL